MHTKGQIISKRFFLAKDSPKKRTKTSHTSKNEFIRSFIGRILGLTICFRDQLTFNPMLDWFLDVLIYCDDIQKRKPIFTTVFVKLHKYRTYISQTSHAAHVRLGELPRELGSLLSYCASHSATARRRRNAPPQLQLKLIGRALKSSGHRCFPFKRGCS